eukprot:CAMPEP_0115232640 /NCGR_PEP_ID=MMETSP0270-20121206/33871_1 /TAXON_ID=71861 /ORGANISM="Scrippsiella trochoidea, Strain CCMP3099" /LENGTH=210 /DNA_ID=CAMNT_0002647341 /DNA_START=449 /DNA_END=1082 /DNA_ORIENTATION=+
MRRRSDEGHMPRLKPAQKGRHQSAARPLRKWPISYLRVQWMQAAAKALHYSSGPELLRDDVIVLDDHVLDVICPESHRSEVGQAHLYRLDHGLILRITAFGGGAVIAGGGGGGGPVFHSRPLHQALLPTFAGGASTSKLAAGGFTKAVCPAAATAATAAVAKTMTKLRRGLTAGRAAVATGAATPAAHVLLSAIPRRGRVAAVPSVGATG